MPVLIISTLLNSKPSCGTLIFLLIRLHIANLQVPMFPLQPIPQIFLPQPPSIAIPIPIAISIPQSTTTTTTTTTEENMAIAVPVSLPLPIQIAIPAMAPPKFCLEKPRPNDCPPCPPCLCAPMCTPPFYSYCSPCHQKCRCRKKEDVPQPMPLNPPQPFLGPVFPMPVPLPPEVGKLPNVVLPYPSLNSQVKHDRHQISSASEETSCSSSWEWNTGSRKGRSRNLKRKRLINTRRSYKVSDIELSDGELVKPVLTYVSHDGDVKLEKRITADEAVQLLGDTDSADKHYSTVKIVGNGNGGKQLQVLIVSDDGGEPTVAKRRKQVVLRKGALQHILGEG